MRTTVARAIGDRQTALDTMPRAALNISICFTMAPDGRFEAVRPLSAIV